MFQVAQGGEDAVAGIRMSQAIEQTTPSSRGATHASGRSPHTADILDRLARLRLVLPALGQELASARREAAKLRVENGRLKERLQRLEAQNGLPRPMKGAQSGLPSPIQGAQSGLPRPMQGGLSVSASMSKNGS